MRRLIRRLGPCTLAPTTRLSPYKSLVRAVAHQQLNGRAAETILARFVALFDGRGFPSPAAVLAASPRALRRAGFSRAKVRAIKEIARHAVTGVVPTRRAAARLSDEQIIGQLTQIHGVGVWTVEMLLPVDDFGVREGYRLAYRLRKQPSPKELRVYGERWKPHRSAAAWYLWRVANEARTR